MTNWTEIGLALAFACGLLFALAGLRTGVKRAAREERDPGRALALLLGFRRAVIGLSIAGVAAALLWDVDWLFGLSLVIAGEELLESTVMITALRHDPHRSTVA